MGAHLKIVKNKYGSIKYVENVDIESRYLHVEIDSSPPAGETKDRWFIYKKKGGSYLEAFHCEKLPDWPEYYDATVFLDLDLSYLTGEAAKQRKEGKLRDVYIEE